MNGGGRALIGAFGALSVYRSTVLPIVRHERHLWTARAAQIPEPALRDQALSALRDKAANVEATAVFATLAPRSRRASVVRAGASLQMAIDYLDSLNEAADPADRLEVGLRLHGALAAAVGGEQGNDLEDGGYLDELLAACAQAIERLPGIVECRARLFAAVTRCGEGQAYTHAAACSAPSRLQTWAEDLGAPPGFSWWETAAGASSSVAAHALLALAADETATAQIADHLDAAYFPAIGALTVLLDDLVDLDEDIAAGEHNYVAYFTDDHVLARRAGWLASSAKESIGLLPRRGRHEAILAGVAGFYLAKPAAQAPRWEPTRRHLFDALGAPARLLTTFSRIRDHGRA